MRLDDIGKIESGMLLTGDWREEKVQSLIQTFSILQPDEPAISEANSVRSLRVRVSTGFQAAGADVEDRYTSSPITFLINF